MLRSRITLRLCVFLLVYIHHCCHISGFEIHSSKSEPAPAVTDSKLDLNVSGFNGKTYNLKLTKSEKSVLHPNIKFFTLSTDPRTGKLIYNPWTPSPLELEKAESVFVDEQNKAVIRATQNDKGHRVLEGTVDGMDFMEANGVTVLSKPKTPIGIDYIKSNVTLTYNQRAANPYDYKFVLELAVVLDKEAGDRLGQDRQKLLNVWTPVFHDVGLRFRTIPHTDIAIKITSFTVITDEQSQPFFVGTVNETTGAYESRDVLHNFTRWLIDTQRDKLPKFDVGILLTNLTLTYPGMANGDSACTPNSAVIGHIDSGNYANNGDLIAHELGHHLGAYHDHEDQASGPGGQPCKPLEGHTNTGFVMGDNYIFRRFFFSECSFKRMFAYVTSDQAACMRRLDEPNEPAISEVIDETNVPTMLEQCIYAWKYKNGGGTNVAIGPGDNANCTQISCNNLDINMGLALTPLDRSPCEYGRCFRGRCISDKMAIIKNTETGKCFLSSDRFVSHDEPTVADCPKALTPLEKYYRQLTNDEQRSFIRMPYSTFQATENEDKCLQLSNVEEGTIKHVRCNDNASGTEWLFDQVEEGKYLIQEAQSKKCLKQDNDKVKAFSDCDKNNKLFVWEHLPK